MNRSFLKILRYINKEKYTEWDWFNKPFSLKNCIFISDNGYKFMSYSKEIFRVLKCDKTEPLNEIKELLTSIAPKCIVLDIGAHLGMYTIRLASICRKGKIIAVEPDPRNREYLRKNIVLNNLKNVEIVPYPVSDRSGEKVKFALATVSGYSRIDRMLNDDELLKYIYIETITVDDLIESIDLERVDFIIIDVEGYELHVLRGAKKTIRKYKPLMLIEVFSENRDFVYKFLEEYGYKVLLKKVSDLSENILVMYNR